MDDTLTIMPGVVLVVLAVLVDMYNYVSPEALFSLRGKQQDCHLFLKRTTRQTVAITDQSPC